MNDVTGRSGFEVAIVGMAGRFPGARSVEELWRNLRDGVEAISFFSDEEVATSMVDAVPANHPSHVKAGGVLADVELFDAGFFGFTPKEAQLTDPQHRVLLECAWEALEKAGYGSPEYRGEVGVYVGAGTNTYLLNNLYANPSFMASVDGLQIIIGNDKDYLAPRLSYKLRLHGPSMTIQSACSSSLSAVHVACRALLGGECDLALAGGVSISVPQKAGYLFQEGGIGSPDGHCRPFDAAARGTVKSNGVGIVVLKRLDDALADGDCVLAVIKGSAVNNDGAAKVGFTAPSVEGQAKAIRAAHDAADIAASTISYVEAHGTGTVLGDPIEVAALAQAFRATTNATGFCALGAVKSNLGHLDAAAGVAGLIKTVLALEHRQLPPTLHYTRPNPNIDFETSPFYVNARLVGWHPKQGETRRAGVSSFGIGGSNAHVVVEEAPPSPERTPTGTPQVLRVSALSAGAARLAAGTLAAHLRAHPELHLADVAYTLRVGRQAFKHRIAVAGNSLAKAADLLESAPAVARAPGDELWPTAFMFPGQGTQYLGMLGEIAREVPSVYDDLESCARYLRPLLGCNLLEVLQPPDGSGELAIARLNDTAFSQPALFVVGYALSRLWARWGLQPRAMIGHSIGEYLCACLAGVFTLEEGLSLVAARGRLMQSMPRGLMLAVGLSESQVIPLLGDDLSLAGVNRRELCVVSGPGAAIDALESGLIRRGVAAHRLETSHAFHSQMMEPAIAPFLSEVKKIRLRPPSLPYLSNVTGAWITAEQATSPDYWAEHLRGTVRFHEGLETLLASGHWTLLEVGPGHSLRNAARHALGADAARGRALSTLPAAGTTSEFVALLEAAGQFWCHGVDLDWDEIVARGDSRRVQLPTYPFQRARHWVDPTPAVVTSTVSAGPPDVASNVSLSAVEPNGGDATPPDGDVVERLRAIWREALGIMEIGLEDDFFALGGDSITSLQICAQAARNGLRILPSQIMEHPTLTKLAAQAVPTSIDGQTPEGDAPVVVELPTVMPAPAARYEPFPLTDIQQAYWIGRSANLDIGNVASHVYQEVELADVDLSRLERAVRRLIDRHPMLRAVTTPDGMQRVLEQVPPYEIEVLDLREQPAEMAAARAQAVRDRMSHQVLPSDRWPVFELRATVMDGGRTRLHISVDILFADTWSLVLYERDVVALYTTPDIEIPPLDLYFRDYVLAEQVFRGSQSYQRSRDYWVSRIPQLPPAPQLPLAVLPDRIVQPRFERRQATLSPERWTRLKQHAARVSLTPPVALCAAFAEVLQTWSASPHFTLNLPVFSRLPVHEQVNEITGDFTSVILLEVDNRRPAGFEERARRLQRQLWKDLEHRHFTGVRVLREIARVAPARAAMPVVFTSLIMPAGQGDDQSSDGVFGEALFSISQTPQVWLDHQVAEVRGGLSFNWDAVADLFPAGMLDEMFGRYSDLLALLADDETAWEKGGAALQGAPRAPEPAPLAPSSDADPELLQTGFLRWAQRAPDALAVISPGRSLSYGALARAARAVARLVRDNGVAAGELVGVAMEKGWEQVAAAIGVLLGGAAYVPIDPTLPAERLDAILCQSGLRLLFTQPWLEERLSLPAGVQALPVGERFLSDGGDDQATGVGRPEDLAYVIYTSGTTGTPKGVMIDHRGAVNTIADINERFAVSAEDRVLALSSLSFDLSVYDVFGTLAAGASIVFPAGDRVRDPAHWAELVDAEKVSVWNSVPALMDVFLQQIESDPEAGLPSLRLAMLSGDWIPVTLPDRLRKRAPRAQVISLGGATEASIWSILYPIGTVDPDWKSIPYGRAMRNQTVTVLDDALAPRPAWVPGGIFVGGVGVALGYWRNPDETHARFVTQPTTGERLYRTGDLGRLLPDGNIEFLGREDFQVKINGYRIELGEVEVVLAQHQAVRTVVVAAVDGAQGSRRLVAYVVAADAGQPPSVEELRAFAARKLPDYMVPAAVVLVASLPLSANGKVDRRALPAPEPGRPDGRAGQLRTNTERSLAEIWRALLPTAHPGADDNFFELGGDSLLATKMIVQIRAAFQADIPLRAVFETPSIGALAAWIERETPRRGGHAADRVPRRLSGARVPLSSGQQRLFFLDRFHPGASTYNVQEAVRLTGELNVRALDRALQEIVRRHEALRTTISIVGDEPVQVISPSGRLPIEHIELSAAGASQAAESIVQLVGGEVRRPFDLARGPLVRAMLVRTGSEEHVLIVTSHHIISDAWSMAVVIRELVEIYRAFARGEDATLPPPALQYADYAVWEQQQLESRAFDGDVAYWRKQLVATSAPLALPVDHIDRPATPDNGAAHPFKIGRELASGLREFCRAQGVTPFMVLLATWQTVLHHLSDQDDILVGSPTANRQHPELEGVVGFFVNTLVMRTNFVGVKTFGDLLASVRGTALDAYAHQSLPFDRVVDELRLLGRGADAPALFRVWFTLQNVPMPALDLGGVTAGLVDTWSLTAVHDLKLGIVDDGEALLASLDYRTHLFEPTTIAMIACLFEHLLGAVIREPSRELSALRRELEQVRERAMAEEDRQRREELLTTLKTVRRKPTRVTVSE